MAKSVFSRSIAVSAGMCKLFASGVAKAGLTWHKDYDKKNVTLIEIPLTDHHYCLSQQVFS